MGEYLPILGKYLPIVGDCAYIVNICQLWVNIYLFVHGLLISLTWAYLLHLLTFLDCSS